ncbi:transcriptional regulator, partial [Bifidobacterium longum]
MSVMDLTNAVLGLLPSMPSGVKVYRQEEPLESEMPPWIIARVSTDRYVAAETM